MSLKINRSQSVTFPHSPVRNEVRPEVHSAHLISVDLWESATGEKTTPLELYSILENNLLTAFSTPLMIEQMKIRNLSRDRNECRTIQMELQDGDQNRRNVIFNAIRDNIVEFVYDQYANYVIQKMCEVADNEQCSVILEAIKSDMQTMTENQNGCRVLQKFVERASPPLVDNLFISLKPYFIPMCYSLNGNRIIQDIITKIPDRLPEIIELIQPHVFSLVVDNCGCRVVQHIFSNPTLRSLEPLIVEVMKRGNELALNQYGNYVVQNILESGSADQVSCLIEKFKGYYYSFSIHKFASNVIEKCIRNASNDEKNEIFNEIIYDGESQDERIRTMIGDRFGNYVIQRVLEYGTKDQQYAIYQTLNKYYDELSEINFSRHVILRLKSMGYSFK